MPIRKLTVTIRSVNPSGERKKYITTRSITMTANNITKLYVFTETTSFFALVLDRHHTSLLAEYSCEYKERTSERP